MGARARGVGVGAAADTGSVVLGCAVCLAGAIFMSLYYVCAEYVMKGPAPPSIRWLSWRIGGAAGSVLLVYMVSVVLLLLLLLLPAAADCGSVRCCAAL
jgi:hypothetical protein